jgi:aryl-alcohol dehydrogenase-like predicted oxidoreductase
MDEAWKNGINFFDSAEVYADGKCEVAMGKAIKALKWKREDFVISTKLFWGGVSPFSCLGLMLA